MAHKTKKLHDSEQVIQLQLDIKCVKNTNIKAIFDKLKRTVNSDWGCILMNDEGVPTMIDKTEAYKESQSSETP
jgi:hypothetical protein